MRVYCFAGKEDNKYKFQGEVLKASPNFEMKRIIYILFAALVVQSVNAGPYTEIGINGYVGIDYKHADPLNDSDAVINPIFRNWSTSSINYLPSDTQWSGPWDDPNKALGPVTGQYYDIVSLGDLDPTEISQGKQPGKITLVFGNPQNSSDANHIRNMKGYDFAVFENGTISGFDTDGGSIAGMMFAELGYVEVSSDGIHFARFPSVSLTNTQVGPYGTIDITNVYNLAGKHPNSYGVCTGTGFDLSELAGEPNVVNGSVDIDNISYVRIVDIPGNGSFLDSLNHPIYEAWPTWGSGGFDLEAIGVMKEQQYSGDINLDGAVDGEDFALFMSAWMSHFGDTNWIGRCDLATPKDNFINFQDYAIFASEWHKKEYWRN